MNKPPSKHSDDQGNYGESYGYGYGYGGYNDMESTPNRSLKDYMLILRERIWWLIAAVFIFFTASIVYTLTTTPLYRSAATFRILREQESAIKGGEIVNTMIANETDLTTEIELFKSGKIVQRVADRLKDEELKAFMDPYRDMFSFSGPSTPVEVLTRNRKIIPMRNSLMVAIQYVHPDKNIAAKVANHFAEEYLYYNTDLQMQSSLNAVEQLKVRAESQGGKVEELERQLAEFKEQHETVTFSQTEDIEADALMKLNQLLISDKESQDTIEVHWNQIQQYQLEDKPLWELSFIAAEPQISQLVSKLSLYNIEKAQLSRRYKGRHPKMIEVLEALSQTQEELERAVESSARKIQASFNLAVTNYENSKRRLTEKQKEIIQLQKVRVDYNTLLRNLGVNEQMYGALYGQMQSVLNAQNMDAQRARIVDNAYPDIRPFKPNIVMNLSMGLFSGIVVGFGFVFVVAFVDDRVKTAFDIETAIGLPLIGLVPRIKGMGMQDKAKATCENADKRTIEAFRSVISTLNLNEESKAAKVLMTTSTVPGEGKSFVSSNIAITFANNGQKTCLVDCDLRMPNIAKSLQLDNEKGVIDFYDDGTPVEALIHKDVQPGLDVLSTGGKARNPTQLLSSSKFENLVHELRMRYDRIIIDCPPLAPVSDALNVLPLVDGVVYVIRFNTVKRKSAKNNVRRLIESNTPVFGAILNNISTSVASYYYSHYYDRDYDSYYLADDDDTRKMKSDKGKGDAPEPEKGKQREKIVETDA